MRLLTVDTLEEARQKLWQYIERMPSETETITSHFEGRVLAEDIHAPIDVPHFRRSTVDGYAVKAMDTQGASESVPTFLEVIGEVEMGCGATQKIREGVCVYVPTGGAVPEGADAMVMVEHCENFGDTHIAIYQASSVGQDIVRISEDVVQGTCLLTQGTRLTSKEIGVLASIGRSACQVYKPYTITILSTGDELKTHKEPLTEGCIYDINTSALASEARAMGLVIKGQEVLCDDETVLRAALTKAMSESDIVITSGGSSKGKKDMTAQMMDELSSSGVLTHGIALKPGKPTITAFDQETQTILLGLPGHPVAALLVFKLIGRWAYEKKLGLKNKEFKVKAKLTTNVPNAPGRMTCQLVALGWEEEGYVAEPILGKSGLMTTLTASDGYVVIDRNQEGLKSGEDVFVNLL